MQLVRLRVPPLSHPYPTPAGILIGDAENRLGLRPIRHSPFFPEKEKQEKRVAFLGLLSGWHVVAVSAIT